MPTRKCCHCKQIKSASAFALSHFKRRAAQCNDCITEIRHEKQRKNGIVPLSDKKILSRKEIGGVPHQLCSHCNEYKPLDEYPPSVVKVISTFAVCHSCIKEETKVYRHAKGVKPWSEFAVRREIVDEIEHQECNHCGELLPLQLFHNDKNTPNGKSYVCKNCCSEQHCIRNAQAKKLIPLKKAKIIELICEGRGIKYGMLLSTYNARVKYGQPPRYCSDDCKHHWSHLPNKMKERTIEIIDRCGNTGGKL